MSRVTATLRVTLRISGGLYVYYPGSCCHHKTLANGVVFSDSATFG